MIANRERELTIQLLTEKIERISGKKVKFLKEEKEKFASKSEIKEFIKDSEAVLKKLANLVDLIEENLSDVKSEKSQYLKSEDKFQELKNYTSNILEGLKDLAG